MVQRTVRCSNGTRTRADASSGEPLMGGLWPVTEGLTRKYSGKFDERRGVRTWKRVPAVAGAGGILPRHFHGGRAVAADAERVDAVDFLRGAVLGSRRG